MHRSSIELDFKDEKLSFHFGLSFLGHLFEVKNLDVVDIYEKISTTESLVFLPEVMYESHKHWCERNQKELKISLWRLQDLIESTGYFLDGSVSSRFVEEFVQSIVNSLPKTKDEKDSKKKE